MSEKRHYYELRLHLPYPLAHERSMSSSYAPAPRRRPNHAVLQTLQWNSLHAKPYRVSTPSPLPLALQRRPTTPSLLLFMKSAWIRRVT
ncbi:hypothetical protein ACA910_006479 [Epithemia clementina (nom. ined.)]